MNQEHQISDSFPSSTQDHTVDNNCSEQEIAAEELSSDSQLDRLSQEVAQYKEQSLRLAADLENYRKRMAKEKEEAIRYANSTLLMKLLPLLDNFELGLEAAKKSDLTGVDQFLIGFEMVERQLLDFLKEAGVTLVKTEDTLFDPQYHEAVGHQESDTVSEGKIIKELRSGYEMAGRLLRPAMVIVSKGKGGSL